MDNIFRSDVNQRLYFCKLHLQWLEEQLLSEQVAKSVLEQALGESIVSHLVLAYRCYLSELAYAYSVNITGLKSAKALNDALAEQRYVSAEANELLAKESSDQWLGELISRYNGLGEVQGQAEYTQKRGSTLIAALHVDEFSPYSFDALQGYFTQLSDIIENQRSRLEEW